MPNRSEGQYRTRELNTSSHCPTWGSAIIVIFNTWRMRRRVTVVVCLCVCLFVTMKSAACLVCTSKTRCHRVVYGVCKVFVGGFRPKLHSKVLASFADCHCLPRFLTSSRRTEETVSDSFVSTQIVNTVSNSIYNTTDSLLIVAH